MDLLRYLVIFLIYFVLGYLAYLFAVVLPHSRALKKSKNKKYPPELQLLRDYYKININKIGVIRTLRILNFVNALMFAALVMIVFNIQAIWLKILILVIIMLPTIWFVYYFIAKYLKHIERKRENV
ncbi:MAG: hypothetical protein J6O56_05105 [Bacilli bacterium]|nr:hypothetical protein [Bacilli bacterium]